MIALAAVAILLPFAAAFVGMLFGPTLSHLLTPIARRVRRTGPGTATGRPLRGLRRDQPATGPSTVRRVPPLTQR